MLDMYLGIKNASFAPNLDIFYYEFNANKFIEVAQGSMAMGW